MSASLRDVAFALDLPGPGAWSLRSSLVGVWPPIKDDATLSLRELGPRYGRAGAELRQVAAGGQHGWTHMHRKDIVKELRERIRNAAIVSQNPTDLCGPFAVLVELGRREPWRYVRAAGRLLDTGELTTGGPTVVADAELRGKPLPPKHLFQGWGPGQIDWMLAATMREEENVNYDIEDGEGWEAASLPGALEQWTRDLLGLRSELFECYHEDELEALRVARKAVAAGGVAFMLVDRFLLVDGGDDHEEDMWYRFRWFDARAPLGAPGNWTHSEDDAWPPSHWVVYLGGLKPANPAGGDQITLRLWSWGKEYEIKGTAAAFGEYLYAVVAGFPK